jgi:hypothetical protein
MSSSSRHTLVARTFAGETIRIWIGDGSCILVAERSLASTSR